MMDADGDGYLPLTLSAPGLTDAQFQDFCEQYADYRLEYTAAALLLTPAPDSRSRTARGSLPMRRRFRGRTFATN